VTRSSSARARAACEGWAKRYSVDQYLHLRRICERFNYREWKVNSRTGSESNSEVWTSGSIWSPSLGISVGSSGTLNALQRIVIVQSCGCRRVHTAFVVGKEPLTILVVVTHEQGREYA
jgi:hypothetical protein